MKKIYSKPEIMFESFVMSVNIAGTCDRKTNTPNAGNCGIAMGSMTVFLDDMANVCNFGVADGTYDSICYHVPSDENELFNS